MGCPVRWFLSVQFRGSLLLSARVDQPVGQRKKPQWRLRSDLAVQTGQVHGSGAGEKLHTRTVVAGTQGLHLDAHGAGALSRDWTLVLSTAYLLCGVKLRSHDGTVWHKAQLQK